MAIKINSNQPFLPPAENSVSGKENVNSVQPAHGESGLITETGFPKYAAGTNLPDKNAKSIAAEGKSVINLRAGLLQKTLNDALPLTKSGSGSTNAKEPTSLEFPNLIVKENE